ncbi:hypothetical protein NECAME_11900 [Necator americanus]|uniref:Uncharacterized protein n=1 Tax=Necator americanus TaxID=51031 RepID=W2T570_NECAM|nr:hypothetical protein NECAME_11900 [Necator americanus]ETN76117.1 hypothetical protein NECAME_11900 [Necator americanus]
MAKSTEHTERKRQTPHLLSSHIKTVYVNSKDLPFAVVIVSSAPAIEAALAGRALGKPAHECLLYPYISYPGRSASRLDSSKATLHRY